MHLLSLDRQSSLENKPKTRGPTKQAATAVDSSSRQRSVVVVEGQFDDAPESPLFLLSSLASTIADAAEEPFDDTSEQPISLLPSLASTTTAAASTHAVDALNNRTLGNDDLSVAASGPTPTDLLTMNNSSVPLADAEDYVMIVLARSQQLYAPAAAPPLDSCFPRLEGVQHAVGPANDAAVPLRMVVTTNKRVYPKPILVPQFLPSQPLLLAPRPGPTQQQQQQQQQQPSLLPHKPDSRLPVSQIPMLVPEQPSRPLLLGPHTGVTQQQPQQPQNHHPPLLHREPNSLKRPRPDDVVGPQEASSASLSSPSGTLSDNTTRIDEGPPGQALRVTHPKSDAMTGHPVASSASSGTSFNTQSDPHPVVDKSGQRQQPPQSCDKAVHSTMPHCVERTVLEHPMACLIPFSESNTAIQAAHSFLPVVPGDKEKLHPVRYDDITDNDVILGRGGTSNHHLGNRLYRALIDKYRPVYRNLPKFDKMLLARNLCTYIRVQWQGRFLVKDRSDGCWYECGDLRAWQKCSQYLREVVRTGGAEASQRQC